MPAIEATTPTQPGQAQDSTALPELRFPPVTKDHILHCGYDFWFPKYRTSCIRSRVIPLTPEFVSYIREDGILLADDEKDTKSHNDGEDGADDDDDDWEPTNPSTFRPPPEDEDNNSDSDSEDEKPAKLPPNKRFPDLHNSINAAIKTLGGAVAPKLNWSSPKDATWISRHPNTMKCTSANDIYILLKSSNFITHDLDHAFDGTTSSPASTKSFTPCLVLRTFFNPLPSLEFRCFVKDRNLVAITQRDLNYYEFLKGLKPTIISRVRELFHKMRFSFPDSCWSFDVYIPEAYYANDSESESDADDEEALARRNGRRLARARLIDINPWAPKTDTLLFRWDELLNIHVARPILGASSTEGGRGDSKKSKKKVVRLPIRLATSSSSSSGQAENSGTASGTLTAQLQQVNIEDQQHDASESETSRDDIDNDQSTTDDDEDDDEEEEEDHEPELRIVEHDDPAAYNFCSPQYSAHKLPKEVVDASMAGNGGMGEFAQRWQRIVEGRERA
ncbi:D123-domain-containing protein [Rhypophila decipiens]|uniref:D123-domain-containing protein n=1 Tax=Rhypophila decipiens TaxID=261697 RepID=A0AAN6Y8S7_9PEZI|nr:D123-domain-containing protein [Rhypophila decipiens]